MKHLLKRRQEALRLLESMRADPSTVADQIRALAATARSMGWFSATLSQIEEDRERWRILRKRWHERNSG